MNCAPIALFCYTRVKLIRQLVAALAANDLAGESDLFIFSDGARGEADAAAVQEVRAFLKTVTGFRSVHVEESPVNQGVYAALVNGVTQIVNAYGRVIVLEDDILPAKDFLQFLNAALDLYANDDRVAGVTTYLPPYRKEKLPDTFFLRKVTCWGWATWQRAWALYSDDRDALLAALDTPEKRAAFDMKNSYPNTRILAEEERAWDIRWAASCFIAGKLWLYAGRRLSACLGYDSGEHFTGDGRFKTETLADAMPPVTAIPVEENTAVLRRVFLPWNKKLTTPRSIFYYAWKKLCRMATGKR